MENWQEDYAPAPELDYYDEALLAGEDAVMETYEDRMRYQRQADEEVDARIQARRNQRQALDDRLEGREEEEQEALDDMFEDEDEDEDAVAEQAQLGISIQLENFQCPLREWIAEERTRVEIKNRFRKFLQVSY